MQGKEIQDTKAVKEQDQSSVPVSADKKERILEAAEKLFGDLGFEAVSIRLLAKEANVNMAMLSYYFGSKEKLFEYMIQRRTEEGRAKIQELMDSTHSPREKMTMVIDMYVNKIFDSGRMHAIFSREISLQQRGTVSDMICNNFSNTIISIGKIIKEGQHQGVFRKVDIEFTIISMMATISYIVNSPAMTRRVFNLDDNEDITKNNTIRKRIRKHLKDMIHTHLEFGSEK